ncbi:hypothetical protein CCACVL1_02181 [Corchorus capsularis]|uniref:Uncharacterized protein n=1 Tax=Corchorus capsularis TaxID=210143 RepID=A0A1R3KAR0_COCAP|nr:hypothetical protein CCACVL1_02181 [Corchorus capsularis]
MAGFSVVVVSFDNKPAHKGNGAQESDEEESTGSAAVTEIDCDDLGQTEAG